MRAVSADSQSPCYVNYLSHITHFMSEQAEWQRCVEESGLSAETALIAMAALEKCQNLRGIKVYQLLYKKECGRLGQPYEKRTINRKRCQISQKKMENKNPMVKI